MDFAEKLNKLLALTETQGAQLAKSVCRDPSQISRMKTGARKRPADPAATRMMADFFSACCGSDYRRSALAKLTGDSRLLTNRAVSVCADAIYAWLISDDDDSAAKEPVGKFLQRVNSFSIDVSGETYEGGDFSSSRGNNNFVAYFNNAGKRQAVLEFIDCILQSDETLDIYLFTDESMDWMNEDIQFLNILSDRIRALAKKGCRAYRIEPPTQGLEETFRSIEMWLPAYMLGVVQQYCYPHLRDNLHRRTLFVAKGKAAVFSRSLAGQVSSRVTTFCADETMVEMCCLEAQDILELCQPAMRVYTIDAADEMFQSLIRFANIQEDGIYKTGYLSIASMPASMMERASRENGSCLAALMLENQRERARLRSKLLQNYRIEDIMTLADPKDVRAGTVPIPSTKMLPDGLAYYTPDEYRMNLQRIIDIMEENYNYQVILTENLPWKDLTIYAKGNDHVLLIKDSYPFAVFEFTESRLASSFCDFLKKNAAAERAKTDREATLRKLREAIAQI